MNHITVPDLGWIIAAGLIGIWVLGLVSDWLGGQYEITRRGPWFRVTRRWYGPRAHVYLRSAPRRRAFRCPETGAEQPERFRVLRWDKESTAVPWLLAQSFDDDGADAFWAPVTDFAPCAVLRFRPHLEHLGRVAFPWPVRYLPLRQPEAGG